MNPTTYEIHLWKAYHELVDKYLATIPGDETLPLAQKAAIKELAQIASMTEDEVDTAINNVCNWLMKPIKDRLCKKS